MVNGPRHTYKSFSEGRGDRKLEEYTPSQLLDSSYYDAHIDVLKKLSHSLRSGEKRKIVDVSEKLHSSGFFDKAVLKIFTLLGSSNEKLVDLFAKMYFPKKKHIDLSPQIRDLSNSIKYQYDQMKFWNNCELSSAPLVIAYDKKPVQIDKEKYFLNWLLMEFCPGSSLDFDVLAIDQKIEYLKERLEDRFLGAEEKHNIRTDIGFLKEFRMSSLEELLRTVNHFGLIGAYNYRKGTKFPSKDFLVDENKSPLEAMSSAIEKGQFYFERFMLWNLVNKGEIDIEAVRKNQIPSGIYKKVLKARKDFTSLISSFVEPLSEIHKYLYRQGDEFLHNASWYKAKKGDITKDEVILYDACHAHMGRLELGKIKAILNHVANLNYDVATSLFLTSEENFNHLILGLGTNPKTSKDWEGIDDYFVDELQNLKDFDFLSIWEIMCCMGRRAQHELINKQYYEKFLGHPVGYSPVLGLPLISKMPETVSLDAYRAEIAIPKLQIILKERMHRMIENNVFYDVSDEERRTLEALMEVFKKHSVLN